MVVILGAKSYSDTDLVPIDPDITPPDVTISQPSTWDSSCSGQPSLQLTGTASDDFGVVAVRWENEAGQSGDCTGGNTWNLSQATLQKGENLICVSAEDAAGNVGVSSVMIEYDPLVTNPAPTVSSISPNVAVNNGSVNITSLIGTGFISGAAVKLTKTGQTDIIATGVTIVSSTQITCTLPITGAATGAWNVVVTNPDAQSGTLANGFTVKYPAPTVTAITPNTGVNNASASVTNLAGTGFVTGATVKLTKSGLTDISATSVTVVSSTKITCTLPITSAGTGAWNVVVTNTDAQAGTLAGGFIVKYPAPTVTAITPNNGVNNASVSVTNLTGTGFTTGATVKLTKTGLTDISATSVTVVSSTLITCTLPITSAGTGAWNVVVTNTDAQAGTLASGFTVKYPAPTVTAITPNSGVNNTSVSVTNLAGTGFVTGATVKLTKSGLSDISATSVTVVSSTQITCTLPITSAGTGAWNVVVTNTDAQSGTLASGFTVKYPAPTVTAIMPNTGVNNASVSVSNLAGTGFVTGATVKLTKTAQIDISASNVTVVSATQITCTLPITNAGTGAWNVVVTNTDAQSGTLASGFTVKYPAPTVTAITPNSGVNNASVSVTNLAGTGFVTGAIVKLTKSGLSDINASSVTVVSSTLITCTLPITSAGTGAWNVVVTNTDAQSGTLASGFTVKYPAPTVTAITSNSGVNNASVSVTNLAGTGFVTGAIVKLTKSGLSDITATSVTVVSSTQITCTLPITNAGTGAWNVVVTNTDAQSGTLAGGFTVKYPAPTVTAITPNTGVNNASVSVTNLAGTGFVTGATVKLTKTAQIDITATNITVVSSTQITCTLPITNAGTGAWNVVVTNTDAQSGTLTGGFTVKYPAPTVTAITPNTGVNNASVSVTNLAGTGFVSGATVKLTKSGLSDISATSVTVVSSTLITCTLPITGAGTGAWNVVVTNTDAQSGTLAGGFTVKYPAPTVTAITPNTGVNNASVSVTNLAGTGFVTGATVKLTKTGLTDISATGVTVVSSTKITCTLPITSAGTGAWNVVVTNTDAQSGTLTGGFTVKYPVPTVTAITPNSGVNNASVSITNLAGTGFVTGATVKLTKTGLTDISATGVTVVSATQITCTLPITGAGTGAWNIVVTNTDAQSGTLAGGFTVIYPAPTVTAITPNTGVNNASVSVSNLAGTGFITGATVKLTRTGVADVIATDVTVVSSTQITCTLPITGAPTGMWNVVVTNLDTQTDTLENGFTVTGLYSLSGTVNLLDYTATPNGVPVTIDVCVGTNVINTVNTTLDALGEFSVPNIDPGTYNIRIKPSHWLRKIVPVTVSSVDGAITTVDVVVAAVDAINGDIDGSNVIDYTDYNILMQQYKKLPLVTLNCSDINGDGAVNATDYSILMKNYKKVGD